MGRTYRNHGGTAAAEVAVLERRPWWTPELQRQFLNEPVRVRSGRGLRDLAGLLTPPPDVLIIEFELAPAGCLQWLGQRSGEAAHVPVVVIGTSRTAELEWLVRELGATEVVLDTVPGHLLAGLCRRQFQRANGRKSSRRNSPTD